MLISHIYTPALKTSLQFKLQLGRHTLLLEVCVCADQFQMWPEVLVHHIIIVPHTDFDCDVFTLCASEAGEVCGAAGVDGVTQRGLGRLHRQVPQQERVSLNAVALFIVVGGVEQLPGQIGPLTTHTLLTQRPQLEHTLLQRQHTARIRTLRRV